MDGYYLKHKSRLKRKARMRYALKSDSIIRKAKKRYRTDDEFAERKRQYNRERMRRIRAQEAANFRQADNEQRQPT